MGEVSWGAAPAELRLVLNEVYAQTFTPLWTHTLETLRWVIKPSISLQFIKVSIQYLKPDGTPTGEDLAKVERYYWSIDPTVGFWVEQAKVNPIQLVEGINYAFVIQSMFGAPPFWCITHYVPLPSTYPRGKLIKSNDGGSTWDTTDLGDLHFGEFGNPPVSPTPYIPPSEHWAVGEIWQANYNVNACTRVSTTNPCTLTMYVSDTPPTAVEGFKTQRGTQIKCLDYFSFRNYRDYAQKEKNDSMYHTFFIHRLKEGQKYWFCFTAERDYLGTKSVAPVFQRTHPGGPPFTTIRRPDARGDLCQINSQIGRGCPNHYLNVDEATPDEDATCVRCLGPWTVYYLTDVYNIPDLGTEERPINQVHITNRMRRQGGYAYACHAKHALKTHGVVYLSDDIELGPTSYKNYHWHLYENPHTLLPWTTQEVNDLQIGVALSYYSGVGWGTMGYCTQNFCKIYHACEAYD